MRRSALLAGVVVLLGMLGFSHPAGAQDGEVLGDVDITFDLGDVDPASGDWTIATVIVSGDLADGQEFTVVLTDANDDEVWSATQEFTAPITEIPVTDRITVGDVANASVEQGLTVVGGVQIEPPVVEWGAGGGAAGGDLALSMVLAVLLVAMVFRTPLPSASTQRWTK